MNAEKTTELRRAAFKNDVKMMVVKNTLLKKALEQLDIDYSGLYGALAGSTTLMLSNTVNAPAKLIKEFRGRKETIPALKAAYAEESFFVGADKLAELAALKSKNELIADVVALLQSPAKNVLSGLQSGAGTIHGLLKTLGERPE